jgi:DTW domain-containing protein YfiP
MMYTMKTLQQPSAAVGNDPDSASLEGPTPHRDNDDARLHEEYEGVDLFERVATRSIRIKEAARSNRCMRCWHDRTLRCICHLIPTLSSPFDDRSHPLSNVRFLVLMHHREYLSAGDDAKLLLAMLPPRNVELFVFGREGDWSAFEGELSSDPNHALTLWPGDGALTIGRFLAELPEDSRWKKPGEGRTARAAPDDADAARAGGESAAGDGGGGGGGDRRPPMLRVVVLDGVYSQARAMFRTMRRRLPSFPKFVALYPDTISVYHRARKNYAAAQAGAVARSSDPEASRVCTVEACALLLRELAGGIGGSSVADAVADELVRAVRLNNDALSHGPDVRPASGAPTSTSSGAAKRGRRKREAREKAAAAAAATAAAEGERAAGRAGGGIAALDA